MLRKILILEDNMEIAGLHLARLAGVPVEVVIASTAAEVPKFLQSESFAIVMLDGIAPSEEGQEPSLVGPPLARKIRRMGFKGPIIAGSIDPQIQELIKEWANRILPHRVYIYDKLDPDADLPGLIRELLKVYPLK